MAGQRQEVKLKDVAGQGQEVKFEEKEVSKENN